MGEGWHKSGDTKWDSICFSRDLCKHLSTNSCSLLKKFLSNVDSQLIFWQMTFSGKRKKGENWSGKCRGWRLNWMSAGYGLTFNNFWYVLLSSLLPLFCLIGFALLLDIVALYEEAIHCPQSYRNFGKLTCFKKYVCIERFLFNANEPKLRGPSKVRQD